MCFTSSNYVNTFSLDFNILLLIAFIISYYLFADKLRLTPSTLLARFIPITKIRNLLLKTLENAAKSRILLACADRRIRQYYLTICAILKHYNFNIHVSLATDTLHLLLKGLVIKMLDFMQDILDDIYSSTIISPLFVLKAPFALYFIRAVYNLHALTHIIQDIRIYRALDSICTRANSEAYYITIVKQFYSIINKKDEVAANIAISNFIYAAAVFQSSSKRHNDPKHCNKKVVRCRRDYVWIQEFKHRDNRRQSRIVTDNRKHIAYIKAFSKILLFNNNRQINNTTRMLSMPFKFYDLSTIICLVHLVLRDLPNLITRTTMSYYVNNYIN
ncbi:hypothetical protein HBI56_238800 [Parastagonospora nodorum]|nr:hypothetical protein HBI56_238800 [Parastagonospora nodorum]